MDNFELIMTLSDCYNNLDSITENFNLTEKHSNKIKNILKELQDIIDELDEN